jgi:hypothetical protein
MLLSQFNSRLESATVAQAIDLDGTNDYFSRASDFTGNADGKTFTFSAWIYPQTVAAFQMIYRVKDAYFYVALNASNQLAILGLNAAGVTILSASVAVIPPIQTAAHVLISIDLANASNRSVYINDVAQTVTWTTYTNDSIDFTRTAHAVGATDVGAAPFKGRLAHVYLDYTYRDLSNSTNRRLFITADRKPMSKASQAALNPILYLPMDDPSTAHVNLGTGGNFTLNGTIARSGRAPNQFNAPYSDLDGSADYLSKTTNLTGISDGKQFTFHSVFNLDSLLTTHIIAAFTSTTRRFSVGPTNNNGSIQIAGNNAAGTLILSGTSSILLTTGRNYVLTGSVDLADANKRKVFLNGEDVTSSFSFSTYTDDSIDFSIAASPVWDIGYNNTNFLNGRLGEVFFHTSYIDLSVAANLAKFVTGTGIDAKPADLGANGELPLGTSPLIYLPMYGNDAGKNYGTGGDFTVNSGPYTGARGPNEFFGNKADFDGSTGYLARTSALTGASDGKTFSISCRLEFDDTGTTWRAFAIDSAAGTAYVLLYRNAADNKMYIVAKNAGGSNILLANTTATFTSGGAAYVQMSFDLTDTGKRNFYVNGVAETMTWTTYTNDTINLDEARVTIGARWSGAAYADFFNGKIAEFFFTTEYIDFSQEANRLKFRDAFGNPVSLGADGSTPTGTAPLIYMRFDPASQGTNAGSGGAFTVNGTISDAGQL